MIQVRAKNKALVDIAVEILKREKPMTLRQLFYRVVSADGMPNSQKEYKRLGGLMTRLREAGTVPRTWIVDHIRATLKPSSWSGLADFGESVRDCYRKDFWPSMPHHIEVFVEKDAIAGTIQPVTREYDVALQVVRGYSSVSFAGEIAATWSEIEKPIFAYYLGDFDPSGFDIERDLREKLARYSGREVKQKRQRAGADDRNVYWARLAVDNTDFSLHNLIRLPVKRSDNRARAFIRERGTDCAEVDAIAPTELRARVLEAIESHIDQERWERLKRVERLEQQTLINLVGKWDEQKVNLDSVSGSSPAATA